MKKFLLLSIMLPLSLVKAENPLIKTINSIASLNSEIVIKNLTPLEFRKNPSDTYAINVDVLPKCADINKDSIKTFIVIDGKTHPMIKNPKKANHYYFDFKMPADANVARYYVFVDYATTIFEEKKERSIKSRLYDLQLINRYPSALDVNRGPVGSLITISGRGFVNSDKILFNQKETETTFVSDNLIKFKVPSLPGDKAYEVLLQGNRGLLPIGEFKIDSSDIIADHEKIALKSYERATIAFEIENEAPLGGIELDITTNIPEGVIMPEISIPAGSKRATVVIEGGRPSDGQIYVTANGFKELTIPILIAPNEKNRWKY